MAGFDELVARSPRGYGRRRRRSRLARSPGHDAIVIEHFIIISLIVIVIVVSRAHTRARGRAPRYAFANTTPLLL